MLKLNVIDDARQHIEVAGDEPLRIEVSVHQGKIIVHAYRGTEPDLNQEPDLVYDGNNRTNLDLESPAPGVTNEIFVI